MSVSKMWSMISGMERERRGESGERYTYQYLGQVAKELDQAVGYTAGGGRHPHDMPPGGTKERLEDYLALGKERREAVAEEPAGMLVLSVFGEDDEPLIAEIKLFAVADGINLENFSYQDGRTDFYRRYSDEDGCFFLKLPAGNYLLEVGKGSEYEIVRELVSIAGGQTEKRSLRLRRFVNLTKRGWYVGDLHHHSVYSSPLYPPQGTDYVYDTPSEVACSMQAAGLTFGALSDHHNVENHREWEALRTDGFLPILSKEISTSNGHVLSLNVDRDVVYRIPEPEERTDEYLRGEFVRVTGEIRELGGHPQLNHPRDMQKAISFNPAYTDIIDIFDTIEIWNGSHPLEAGTTNDEAMQLWLSLLEEGRFIAATTGSDTHEVSLEFWQEAFAYVFGLYRAVEEKLGTLEPTLRGKAEYFLGMLRPQLGLLERWGKKNLSSGCVRTYVLAGQERTPEALLSHLKRGNSFLTNGPILIAEIGGKGMGETAEFPVDAQEITAQLTILSNRPLSRLILRRNGNRTEELPLPAVEPENGCYDYSGEVRISAEQAAWVLFLVKDDCTTQAVTNPIFLKAD